MPRNRERRAHDFLVTRDDRGGVLADMTRALELFRARVAVPVHRKGLRGPRRGHGDMVSFGDVEDVVALAPQRKVAGLQDEGAGVAVANRRRPDTHLRRAGASCAGLTREDEAAYSNASRHYGGEQYPASHVCLHARK